MVALSIPPGYSLPYRADLAKVYEGYAIAAFFERSPMSKDGGVQALLYWADTTLTVYQDGVAVPWTGLPITGSRTDRVVAIDQRLYNDTGRVVGTLPTTMTNLVLARDSVLGILSARHVGDVLFQAFRNRGRVANWASEMRRTSTDPAVDMGMRVLQGQTDAPAEWISSMGGWDDAGSEDVLVEWPLPR